MCKLSYLIPLFLLYTFSHATDKVSSSTKTYFEGLPRDYQQSSLFASHSTPGFSHIMYPINSPTFFQDYWDKKPIYIKRWETFYAALFSDLRAVDGILLLQKSAEQEKRLLHPSGKWSQGNCEWVHHGFQDKHTEYNDLYHAYLQGATIVCHLVPSYWSGLAKLALQLQEDLGFAFSANMYLSPRETQGFGDHTDNKNGFILQTGGRKRWICYESSFLCPLREHQIGRPWEDSVESYRGALVVNQTLESGDLLFVPRGIIHSASSSDSPSLHFTFSPAKNLEWCTFLVSYLASFPRSHLNRLLAEMDPSEFNTEEGREYTLEFFTTTLSEAIGVELGRSENFWLRASLPPNYIVLANREFLWNSFLEVLQQLRAVMLVRLEPILQDTENILFYWAFNQSFDILTTHTPLSLRNNIIDKILKEEAVTSDYVKQLNAVGSTRGVPLSFEFDQTSQWRTVPTIQNPQLISSDQLSLTWKQTPSGDSKSIILRKTSVLETTLNYILQKHLFQIQDLPSDDPFERVCLVRFLVSKGLLQSGFIDHEDL